MNRTHLRHRLLRRLVHGVSALSLLCVVSIAADLHATETKIVVAVQGAVDGGTYVMNPDGSDPILI